jgi:hypothetical protein
MIPIRFEDKKIIFNGGERDVAAHDQTGDIHEETEVANVGDEGRVALRFAGTKLRFEERVELHIFAVTLRVGGISLGHGDVFGSLAQGGE